MTTQEPPQTLSVSQLNGLAKQLLEDCFAQVNVTGELSTLSRPSSGHWYFTLKDDRAQIRCAFFKGKNMRVNFNPEPGQQVSVRGKVSLYEGRGDYQLIVDSMQQAGAGALALAFEKLKQELLAAGWFDPEHKKPLPATIKHVAVVTSPTGAAIHDILSVFKRRWPAMQISVLPVLVQGNNAAGQIANAIAQANHWARTKQLDFDVILVSRGGGSLEDLWPFNEHIVAAAIHDSELPVISAVGHEVDFSISDFVADIRAATPSAAAELLSPDQAELVSKLHLLKGRLAKAQQLRLRRWQEQLLSLSRRVRDPRSQLREQSQRLDDLELRLQRQWQQSQRRRQQRLNAANQQLALLNPERQLKAKHKELSGLRDRMQHAIKLRLQQPRIALKNMEQQLRALGPEQTLNRGYAIISDQNGAIVRDADALKSGDQLNAKLAKGAATLTVSK
ncbi:exodeoxyribonuclease VII large subunit [gamma proteobacterium BDW918]|uniref:Exodeoxyribonuclease 7 large subunit n=1 Tax=Zhongshania aliphaticivorans TaxID=1470434 RepID=A0A127M603_9GAMM|nr:exodeoxyribonuclease VII large subunit [Zhongshania aliphaticivorans]AMO68652.1 exodeoxyribonuclease VII large subunit [Zhongshania aliphaticivorans]EIF43107.1 exodeoxyribonuclease VII large subunit [gamma proteobacterium BDW918]